MARDFSVVVFGATGITGRGVARLPGRASADQRLRVGGRGTRPREGRQRVLGELGVTAPETIAADVEDAASLDGDGLAHEGRARPGRPLHPLRRAGDRGLHRRRRPLHRPDRRDPLRARDDRARPRARRRRPGVKIVNVERLRGAARRPRASRSPPRPRASAGARSSPYADLDAELPLPGRDGQALRHRSPAAPCRASPRSSATSNAAALADPAALIDRRGPRRSGSRNVSPIAIAPRFGAQGEVIGPMTPAAVHQPGRHPPHGGSGRRRGRPGVQPLPLPRGRRDPRRRRDAAAALRWRRAR